MLTESSRPSALGRTAAFMKEMKKMKRKSLFRIGWMRSRRNWIVGVFRFRCFFRCCGRIGGIGRRSIVEGNCLGQYNDCRDDLIRQLVFSVTVRSLAFIHGVQKLIKAFEGFSVIRIFFLTLDCAFTGYSYIAMISFVRDVIGILFQWKRKSLSPGIHCYEIPCRIMEMKEQ